MVDAKTVDAGLLQSRYRLTKQRAAVLRALGDGTHLSAEEILGRVRGDMPNVSLGTIYRTLDILREIGLVQMVSMTGLASRYEASLDKHHHVVCTSCREIVNVRVDGLGDLARDVASRAGYRDIDFALTINGVCNACAIAASANGETATPNGATAGHRVAAVSRS
jgi:Fe2+ or Zn2+ uptake regulation protein